MCLILYIDYILGPTNSGRQILLSLILEMRKLRFSRWPRGLGAEHPGPLTLLTDLLSTARAGSAVLTIDVPWRPQRPNPSSPPSLCPPSTSLAFSGASVAPETKSCNCPCTHLLPREQEPSLLRAAEGAVLSPSKRFYKWRTHLRVKGGSIHNPFGETGKM